MSEQRGFTNAQKRMIMTACERVARAGLCLYPIQELGTWCCPMAAVSGASSGSEWGVDYRKRAAHKLGCSKDMVNEFISGFDSAGNWNLCGSESYAYVFGRQIQQWVSVPSSYAKKLRREENKKKPRKKDK